VFGCERPETKQCREQYLEAHALVSGVDTTDLESVEKALALVDPTLALCERANLADETDQLTVVRRKLQSHQEYIAHAENKKALTPAEIDQLVKNGDPTCPKGTAYMYQKSQRKIECKGPQIVDMNWTQATEYFSHRRFKISNEGSKLKAESGSVSHTYTFAKQEDSSPASCLVVYSTPTIPWEETAARLTGEKPRRIKRGEPIKTASGPKPLTVEQTEIQWVVKIGDCG
jgi:hypothetical protein